MELKRRGFLSGALSPTEPTLRHCRAPGFMHRTEHRILNKFGYYNRRESTWGDEKDGIVGRFLRRLEPGTPVIYECLTPAPDPDLNLRRFRFMDISVVDAVRYQSYGYEGFTEEQLRHKIDIEKRSLEHCEGVLALSTYAADAIARDLDYPREKIVPIGAGAGFEWKGKISLTKGRHQDADILFIGRDWERKGGPMLLEAFRLVRRRLRYATLTVVGLEQSLADEPGLRVISPINKELPEGRRQLAELFSSASVFCMPSSCECWGLVYVEAAGAELPIVGFDDWAMPDIVESGVTGRLTSDHTAKGLAEALLDVLSSPERREEMGRAAARRVEEVLDWPHVVNRLLSLVLPDAVAKSEVKWLQAPVAYTEKVQSI